MQSEHMVNTFQHLANIILGRRLIEQRYSSIEDLMDNFGDIDTKVKAEFYKPVGIPYHLEDSNVGKMAQRLSDMNPTRLILEIYEGPKDRKVYVEFEAPKSSAQMHFKYPHDYAPSRA